MIEVRTTYAGPDAAGKGSRIIVRGEKGQRTYPYDYSAYDPHTAAAERYATDVHGMSGASGERMDSTRSRRGYVVRVDYR